MPPSREVFEFGRLQGAFPTWAVVAAVVAVAACWRLYANEQVGRSRLGSWLLLTLRLAAFGLLALVFLDPRVRTETTIRQLPRIALLVDKSQSMAHVDRGQPSEGRSRFARAAAALDQAADGRWGEREVSAFSFGSVLEAHSGAWNAVRPDADATRLGDAVVAALHRDAGRPPAAMVVVSDGRSNPEASIDGAIRAAQQARVPIHTVSVGSDLSPPNLRLADLRIPSRVYRGDQVKGTVLVQSTGMPRASAEVTFTLRARGGSGSRKVASTVVAAGGDAATASAALSFDPPSPGNWELTASTPVLANEVDRADNSTTAPFEVVDRKTKVLLFSSGPSREYQFLRNLLFRDPTVELSVLLQSASRGASQEAKHLLTRFPQSREELFAFDCLIALESDWSRLDAASRTAVAEWISRRGGGAAFVGSAPAAPEMAGLCPVASDGSEAPAGEAGEAWALELTAEGESSAALRLADDAAASKRLWEEFPGFYETPRAGRRNPGATVWLRSTDPRRRTPGGGEPAPVLAVQFVGAGRAAWLSSAEMWRLRRLGEKYYERLWTQVVRHLSEGRLLRGSGRGALTVERRVVPPGSQAPVRAWLLDERFQPLKAPTVRMSVSTSSGPREVELAAQPGQPGRYGSVLSGLPPGEVRLQVLLSGGEVLEEQFRVAESSRESDDLRSDRPALARLSKETGGRMVELGDLGRLIAELPADPEESVASGVPRLLWDRGWIAALFVGLLAAEWILRKLHNLA